MSVAQNGSNRGEEFAPSICFQHISMRASVDGCAPYVGIALLRQKHNLGFGCDLLDLGSSLKTVQDRHSNIKEYQIGIQFRRPLGGLEAVTRLRYDPQFWLLLYYFSDSASPRG